MNLLHSWKNWEPKEVLIGAPLLGWENKEQGSFTRSQHPNSEAWGVYMVKVKPMEEIEPLLSTPKNEGVQSGMY